MFENLFIILYGKTNDEKKIIEKEIVIVQNIIKNVEDLIPKKIHQYEYWKDTVFSDTLYIEN